MEERLRLQNAHINYDEDTYNLNVSANMLININNPASKEARNIFRKTMFDSISDICKFAFDNLHLYMVKESRIKEKSPINKKLKIDLYDVQLLNINDMERKLTTNIYFSDQGLNFTSTMNKKLFFENEYESIVNFFERFHRECFNSDLCKAPNYNMEKDYLKHISSKQLEQNKRISKYYIDKLLHQRN